MVPAVGFPWTSLYRAGPKQGRLEGFQVSFTAF